MKKGDTVRITFDDHCQHSDRLMRFVVHGRIASCRGKRVVVEGWTFADPRQTENASYNITKWAIGKALITKVEQLYPRMEYDGNGGCRRKK